MMSLAARLASGLAAFFLAAGAALAGDIAGFRPLGFSDDGSVFAFEEFGVQDGSGFPYAHIFFLDTVKDEFLPGTPYRVRLDDDNATLGEARDEVRSQASALVSETGIGKNPGLLAAFNPLSETGANPHALRYYPYETDPQFGEPVALALTEIPLAPAANCHGLTDGMAAFRLELKEAGGTAANRVLHEDDRVPESRRCPQAYRLAGAMVFHPRQGGAVHIALIQVLSLGFEGRDGRYLAVPFRP